MSWQEWANIATVVAAIAAAVGLLLTGIGFIFAGKQVRVANNQVRLAADQVSIANRQLQAAQAELQVSQRTAMGEFLLHLDEMFRIHEPTHRRLRPGGAWAGTGKGPESVEDWADVEAYMGLFERIKVLVDKDIVEADLVNRFYGYRLTNIVENDAIRTAKLEDENIRRGWSDFIELAVRLGRYKPTAAARQSRAG